MAAWITRISLVISQNVKSGEAMTVEIFRKLVWLKQPFSNLSKVLCYFPLSLLGRLYFIKTKGRPCFACAFFQTGKVKVKVK